MNSCILLVLLITSCLAFSPEYKEDRYELGQIGQTRRRRLVSDLFDDDDDYSPGLLGKLLGDRPSLLGKLSSNSGGGLLSGGSRGVLKGVMLAKLFKIVRFLIKGLSDGRSFRSLYEDVEKDVPPEISQKFRAALPRLYDMYMEERYRETDEEPRRHTSIY